MDEGCYGSEGDTCLVDFWEAIQKGGGGSFQLNCGVFLRSVEAERVIFRTD